MGNSTLLVDRIKLVLHKHVSILTDSKTGIDAQYLRKYVKINGLPPQQVLVQISILFL